MTITVHVWVRDDTAAGGTRILDAASGGSSGGSELAGFERTRRQLWGSAAARQLGATFLPQLAETDLWVDPTEVEPFAQECALLLAELPALSAATGFDEDYIRARLHNLVQAARRAVQVGGGILIS